jgi:hypothetical protein
LATAGHLRFARPSKNSDESKHLCQPVDPSRVSSSHRPLSGVSTETLEYFLSCADCVPDFRLSGLLALDRTDLDEHAATLTIERTLVRGQLGQRRITIAASWTSQQSCSKCFVNTETPRRPSL